LLTRVGLTVSKREARDLLSAGAISVNGRRIAEADTTLTGDALRFDRFLSCSSGEATRAITPRPSVRSKSLEKEGVIEPGTVGLVSTTNP